MLSRFFKRIGPAAWIMLAVGLVVGLGAGIPLWRTVLPDKTSSADQPPLVLAAPGNEAGATGGSAVSDIAAAGGDVLPGNFMIGNYVNEVNSKTFQINVLQSDKPVVVVFWAPWSGPCRDLMPTFNRAAARYDGSVMFGKLNVDENSEIASLYNITSIPTIFMFKNGKVVDQTVGGNNLDFLLEFINMRK